MNPFITLVQLLVFLPMIAFWMWMFWDMRNNDELPGDVRANWTILFVILNIFFAIYYYAYVYRNRRGR